MHTVPMCFRDKVTEVLRVKVYPKQGMPQRELLRTEREETLLPTRSPACKGHAQRAQKALELQTISTGNRQRTC